MGHIIVQAIHTSLELRDMEVSFILEWLLWPNIGGLTYLFHPYNCEGTHRTVDGAVTGCLYNLSNIYSSIFNYSTLHDIFLYWDKKYMILDCWAIHCEYFRIYSDDRLKTFGRSNRSLLKLICSKN